MFSRVIVAKDIRRPTQNADHSESRHATTSNTETITSAITTCSVMVGWNASVAVTAIMANTARADSTGFALRRQIK
jgi:hypothetical protein